jgi:MATE family multidrug resistance protein
LTVIYMTVCGVLFFVFRHSLAEIFVGAEVPAAQAAEIVDIGGKLLICAAIFQTFDAFGIVFTGALRGAGDTVWPGVMTIVYSWVFIVLGGWLFVRFAPELQSIGPWIAASLYIILFGMTVWWRFATGRWRSIDLLTKKDSDAISNNGMPAASAVPPATNLSASVRDHGEPVAAESTR